MGLIADIHKDLERGALQLIVEYYERLHALAAKMCGDEAQAEDLVFRTFERVLTKAETYKSDTNLFGWMKSIMENIHKDDMKRPVARNTTTVEAEELERCAGADWSTDDQILKNSDSEALREALRGLDPKYNQVLLMRYYQEFSMKQIANILRLPLGTVARRVQIAHQILAGKLRAEFGKAKKPLAVLFAALFGIGALFGAWQAGLLEPLFSQSVEAERGAIAQAIGEALPESFPLQEETFQSGEADQSKEATKSGESNQRGEAESFPLHGGPVSTQLQSQSETSLTQDESQSETTKEQTMNMKTVKTLAASAVVAANAAVANATTITIKNFDEDLATVYVNDMPTTNGQQVAVEGQVTIELKDFRNDYYFRYAPASQTDRQLAFESWETGSKLVPAECATQNPAEFTVSGNLTVTPNVNVKGYCWEYQEVEGVKQMTNNVYRWGWGSVNATTRTATPGVCIGPHVSTEENNLLLDCIERVRYNGKNYTVTSIAKGAFANSHLGTWAVAPRYATFVSNLASGSGFCLTNTVGFYDIKSCTFAGGVFAQTYAKLKGPATNCVPRNATSIGSYPYMGQSGMTGELLLEKVATIGNKGFNGCSGLTSLRITSPDLASIADLAFSGCNKMKEVIFAGSLANFASIGTTAFSANVVTNFNFLVAPPTATMLDNLLIQTSAGDGAHACRLTVDSSMAAWWALTSLPSAAELGAGLPENCMGTYVTGANERKAWVISSTPVGGILLVGDMSMEGNAGFVPRTGLEIGSKVVLEAPDGYDQCQLQHLVDGQWSTDKTLTGTTVTYEHDGQLTRAVWSVDGAKLTKKVNGYGGAIDVTVVSGKEISDGIYEKGSVVRLTASGAAEHPTSHFAGWTKGVDDAQAGTATVEVTLDADVEVSADFSPDEWLYTKSNATSGTLTDGEWTMTATKTDDELKINSASGGQNGLLWLDLTLPVRDSEDLESNYPITVLNCSPTNMRKLRVAPHFKAFGDGFMQASTVLERIDGLGASQVTSFGGNFLYQCGNCPLHSAVYEANDFIPPGLRVTGWYSHPEGVPYLRGTLELNAVTDLYTPGVESFTYLNSRLWGGVVEGETVGVTNILLTTKGLQEIPDGIFGNARVEAVTIGSTNLTTAGTSAFKNYDGAFRSLTFLAHPPTVAALDNLVKVAPTTNLTVYASKFVPGWKAMRAPGYSAMDEWAARPAGCWGIYQTADGKKRYYLVQKDSKYDKRKGFAVLVK